jgi:hypothetical protein
MRQATISGPAHNHCFQGAHINKWPDNSRQDEEHKNENKTTQHNAPKETK